MINIITGIDTDNPIATVTDEITTDSAQFLAAGIRDLSARGIKPKVNINTPGGGVFPGFDIIDAIHENGLNTHVTGAAFSMGGMILMFGKHRSMNDFAMIMLHTARGKAPKELLDKTNANFRAILENTTNIPKSILDRIFVEGKDVFFDATDAERFKMVDEVIVTKVRLDDKIHELTDSQTIENFHNSIEMANLCEIFNKAVDSLENSQSFFLDDNKTVKTNKQIDSKTAYTGKQLNIKEMENEFKEVKSQLGLDSSDNEKSVVNAIKAQDTKIGDLKAEVELKDGEIQRLNKEITSLNAVKSVELVENAIKDGKLDEKAKDATIAFANLDYNGCKNMIDGLKADATPDSVTNIINNKVVLTGDEELIKRGYDDIAAKNPELFETMSEEVFNELSDKRTK